MEPLLDGPSRQAEYEALYRKHSARVERLSRLLLEDVQEARDVRQEVFLKLLRTPERPRPAEWGRWLTRVTINACRDRRRAGWWQWWRRRHQPIDEVEVEDREATPERAALSGEDRERIWRAFRQLPPRQREVFALRHLEEWSTQEVAEALGLSPGTVKRHLFRAVRHLRKGLGGRS